MAISTELLGKDKSLEAMKLLLSHLKEKYNASDEEILKIIAGETKEEGIPLAAFSNEKLSSLEIIVKYLKENSRKTYHEIALIMNRDDRTIWSTYSNSLKKQKKPLKFNDHSTIIPYSIFYARKNSILESLVLHLKDQLGISYNKIAELLLKDYQTIYTTYRKGRSKKDGK